MRTKMQRQMGIEGEDYLIRLFELNGGRFPHCLIRNGSRNIP